MKISDVRELLRDKRVVEEINRHLWIESQKAGYSIGIERATDEWLRLYADGWMKYHLPEKYRQVASKKKKEQIKKKRPIKPKKVVSKTKAKAKAAKPKPKPKAKKATKTKKKMSK